MVYPERARRELATGETVRTRSVETRGELTRQKTQIVRVASNWRPNREIGTELFISPRTVEWRVHQAGHPFPPETRDRTGQLRLPTAPV